MDKLLQLITNELTSIDDDITYLKQVADILGGGSDE